MNKRKLVRGVSLALIIISVLYILIEVFRESVINQFVFEGAGNFRSDGVFKVLSPAIEHFVDFVDHMDFIMPLFFLAGIAGVIALRPIKKPGDKFHSHRIGLAGIAVGGIANLLVLAYCCPLFWVPPGSDIRPMMLAAGMFILAVSTLIVSLPMSLIAVVKEKPRYVGIISLFLCITPYPFFGLLFNAAMRIVGFTLAD